jgi:putative oxygen-independent coproporphyrinogen III oxidase
VASVYVHFPYCLTKCPYCDFVSYKAVPEEIPHAGYADAVISELRLRRSSFSGRDIRSVFFGGGTPSLWQTEELGRVLAAIKTELGQVANLDGDLEVSAECNPTSLDRAKADALFAVGINRLSIGVQGLQKDDLAFLGRLHTAEGGQSAVAQALSSSVPRVSADFIFGLPSGRSEQEATDVLELQSLGLQHMSCYQLTIEAGTRFGELARIGRLPSIDDAKVADAFVAISDALEGRGLRHYEISNYAAPGQEARHNLGYWRGEEYLGLGCGAYGFVRNASAGVRYRNQIDPKRYIASTAIDIAALEISEEALDGEALLRERIMLGLRLAGGFNLTAAAEDLGTVAWTGDRKKQVSRLVERGRLSQAGDVLEIPKRAWLYADDTAARLF